MLGFGCGADGDAAVGCWGWGAWGAGPTATMCVGRVCWEMQRPGGRWCLGCGVRWQH